jgi:hypothetical protein
LRRTYRRSPLCGSITVRLLVLLLVFVAISRNRVTLVNRSLFSEPRADGRERLFRGDALSQFGS